MKVAMAADAVSATVKVARRINGSRNNSSITRGASESSPRISRSSSISRDISERSPRISSGTSNISDRTRNRSLSRGISRSRPHSIQKDRVRHTFVSGVVNVGIFCQSAVQYLPRVFLTRTRARRLLLIHIETTPILGADLLHHHSQPSRRRTRMDRRFRPSRPRALSPNRPPWRNLRLQASCAYRMQAL